MIQEIKKIVQGAVGGAIDLIIEIPATETHGHYATSVALRLAKEQKMPPLEVANTLAEKIRVAEGGKLFAKLEVAPPGFINFWITPAAHQSAFLNIYKAGTKWGKPHHAEKNTVVIDYSHPNIAKPMSIAHMRSTVIGDALYRIFKFAGWKTISDNHLGDWGKQFGILIAAYRERQGNSDERQENSKITIDELMRLYVAYNARMKENPALEDDARKEVKKLQDGDKENMKLWKEFYRVSLTEFKAIYNILGVRFDYYLGESFYNDMLGRVVEDALHRGIAQKSEGAVIIPIEDRAPFVIQKSDGAYLYSTTDLAAIIYRNKRFKPNLALFVVDNGQSLHFEQLFEAAEKLGYTRGENLAHVKFGLILGEDLKKLSTRAGKHIKIDEVFYEAIQKAESIIREKRGADFSEKKQKEIAKIVGIAALKYNDLSQNRQSDIAFRWDKMLNFEGNSAPYLLYTYARLKSILRKARAPRTIDAKLLSEEGELRLVRSLLQFPAVIERVTKDFFPHHLTDYLYNLTQQANVFYHHEPILQSEPALRDARLALVKAIAQTLETGLGLLGIEVPEEM